MSKKHRNHCPDTGSAPVGGVGTGFIEFGRDGHLRGFTTNNNRAADEAIPQASGAFMAVRAATRGKVYARILQTSTGLPFEQAGMVPPILEPGQLGWKSLYPTVSYTLDDDKCPVKVMWHVFSPVIPYDTENSTLPLILMPVSFKNESDQYIDVAACFNWENLSGCTGRHFEDLRGPIKPVVLRNRETPAPEDEPSPEDAAEPIRPAGLVFGHRERPRANHDGTCCLVLKQVHDVAVSLMSWNERDPAALETFWNSFYEHGHLRNALSRDPRAHSGAVCGASVVPPGETRSMLFALAWYFPRYEVEGRDIGNSYAARMGSATQVAESGLKYAGYYQRSVRGWHTRLLESSLPRWFSRMLINSCHVLTTNSICTHDGDFSLFESAENPAAGKIEHALYQSLTPLLFFPELANRELARMTWSDEKGTHLARSLGRLCLHMPEPIETPGELAASGPLFVLLVYRNFTLTGRMLTLVNLFPAAQKIMATLARQAPEGSVLPRADGQPLVDGRIRVNGINACAAGLGVAALEAYVRMARRLGRKQEVDRFTPLAETARQELDALLWDPGAGRYRFCAEGVNPPEYETACHAGQLTGEWASRSLGMGPLLPEEHVTEALKTITRTNSTAKGLAELRAQGEGSVPVLEEDLALVTLYPAYYAALQVTQGEVDRGLHALKQAYDEYHVKAARPFAQPIAWDLARSRPAADCAARHATAPALWHVLDALVGVHLDMAEQTLRIQPNLPLNVHYLSVPVFTPLCFGTLTFQEDAGDPYQQRVRIAFDSPILVKSIVLRVPARVEAVSVHTDASERVAHAVHTLTLERPGMRTVTLKAAQPIEVGSGLTLTLRQMPRPTTASPPPASRQQP